MNNDRLPRPKPHRQRWLWTLLKCAMVTATFTAAGAASLWWLLHRAEAPWFIPEAVFAWLVEVVAPYAAWLGGFVGLFFGFIASVIVLIVDASRGRLSKLR